MQEVGAGGGQGATGLLAAPGTAGPLARPLGDGIVDTEKYIAAVIAVLDATPTVKLIRLAPPAGKAPEFLPGQFITVFLKRGEELVKRQYSISSPPHIREYIELCVKRIDGGFASNYLCNLRVGDTLLVQGPYGKFVLHEPLDHDPIFVATGTGVAPFMSMIQSLLHQNASREVWLFLGVRTEDEIIYRAEFEQLAREHPNFHFIPTLSRPKGGTWKGEVGYVQVQVPKHIASPEGKGIYICGLRAMVDQNRQLAAELGFPKERIFYEKYD